MAHFVPGLELSRALYEEQIAPLMARHLPGLPYAAATYGMCSEVIGMDDPISMDHEWGPRVTIVLSEPDHVRHAPAVLEVLRASLPDRFHGFPTTWPQPGVDLHDTRETILYKVRTSTVDGALRFCGGKAALPLQPLDWLRVSEQHLFEFTAGVVYRDDTGEFTQVREALAHYPDDVLKFLLMAEWNAIGTDWFPLGRLAPKGDLLGLQVLTAQIVRQLMRIAFMVSRSYMPYKKWFGMRFKLLPVADELEPVLLDLLQEANWRKVEEKLGDAAAILLEQQTQLGLGPPITLRAEPATDGRHHISFDFWEIGRKLTRDIEPTLKALIDNHVFWKHDRTLILHGGEVGKWFLLLQK